MQFYRKHPPIGPAAGASSGPTTAELKVRVALRAVDQAAQAAAARTVGLDTKASILLVVAGIIVTSSFSGDGLLSRVAALLALAASIFSLISLWPRKVRGVHPTTITDHLTSNKETLAQFEHWLLAMHKAAGIERERHLRNRGRLLIVGFVFAVAAMTCAALSLAHSGNWLADWLFILHHGNIPKTPTGTPATPTL